jgi:hypothetical protein
MKYLPVILTKEACTAVLASFQSDNKLLALRQYEYYREHAVKQGWTDVLSIFPEKHNVH